MAIQYNSNYDKTIPFSDVSVPVALNANVEETYTLNGNETINYSINFSINRNSNIYVGKNVTPVIPTLGTAVLQPYVEYNPGQNGFQYYAKGGDVLHFITPDTTAYLGFSIRRL